MDERSAEVGARQNLLDRLLDAVKQCQVHFGARQEMATETDLRVATLCAEWEAVFLHGMKRNKPRSLRVLMKNDTNAGSLWPLTQLCLSSEEMQRFTGLKEVVSDVGKGRAWLRAAINERTLENYLHAILANYAKLQSLYEPHAFLLDQERSSMLPVMARGLDSILFSIPVDASYLNSLQRAVEVPVVAPQTMPTQTTILDRLPPASEDASMDDSVVAVSVKEKKKPKKKTLPLSSIEPLEQEEEGSIPGTDIGPTPESLSSSSLLSVNSGTEGEGGGTPLFVSLDMGGVSGSELANSETEAAVNATALVLSATSQQQQLQPQCNSLSLDDLREALLAMVKTKDEVEERNRQLEGQLSEVQSSRQQLLAELEQAREDLRTSQESYTTQHQALERENDLLREQLKKHVGMLQAHRKESSAKLTESLVSSTQSPPTRPSENAAEQYTHSSEQQKLSQMAEMYGELMEFNERIHRDLSSRDNLICKLVSCIKQAGIEGFLGKEVKVISSGPFTISNLTSQLEIVVIPVPLEQLPPAALKTHSLVEVWIPSVIKKGRGPDSHHVYQVFVKVKSEEWNVYRRYAEFREFHRQLQQCVPEVNTFNFPPKKALGSKSSQLVEERQQRLQEYLRFVIVLCTSTNRRKSKSLSPISPIIKPSITKASFTEIFPFFKEGLDTQLTQIPPQSPSYSGL